jgi:VanZ family protein
MSDKAAHVIAYAALGASLVRALAGGRASAMTARRIGLAALIAVLYGASDEIHQMFVPNRTPELLDLVADACGGLAGAVLLAAAARLLQTILPARKTS